jgi:3-methyl-2-oxobutanoate hydroxymethyltransferase
VSSSVESLKKLKGVRKISMLTAYDAPMAAAIDAAGLDSVANVVLGLASTKEVTMDQMIYYAAAARRGVKQALLVGDMPFVAYQVDTSLAVFNARRFVDEAGCDAVKIEWFDHVAPVVTDVLEAGIPVMGHIGLTPQTADKLGGFKVQGQDAEAARRLIEQAKEMEAWGCFSVLLECVPDRVAEVITRILKVPTIGIGAGPYCDGQVLVTHDMLGLTGRSLPRFVKRYALLNDDMIQAFQAFRQEVEEGVFPAKEHSYGIKTEELNKLLERR